MATGPNTALLAVGDFNGDGKLDIVTASRITGSYSGTLSLLLGNGDGTFQSHSNFNLPYTPLAIAAGDMNHDGRDDLVIMGSYSDPYYHLVVNVLLGQANRSFATGSDTVIDAFSSDSMTLGDCNGDGNLDVAMLSRTSSRSEMAVMLGDGQGDLAAPTITPIATPIDFRSSLAVGDFNGDGKLDLVAADYNGENLHVLLGNGDGSFDAPTNIPLPPSSAGLQTAGAVVMGDIDRDGKMDLAVSAESSYQVYAGSGPYGPYYNTITAVNVNVLLGHGDGTFTDAETVPVFDDAGSVAPAGLSIVAATFNGDAFPDLAVADPGNDAVSVLLNGADWSTNPGPSSFAVSGFPSPTTAGAAGSFTVTALNADRTIDTGYTGTVSFSSTDGQAARPAAYTFTAADAGVHTFSATLKTAGTQALYAGDGSITGSETGITLTPAAASELSITAPGGTVAGSPFSVTVTARDPYNNIATGYTGTVSFTSSDAKAILPAKYTFTSGDAGSHSFSGVVLKTAGTQTITATDTATASITSSAAVAVSPAAASKFIVSGPSSVQPGVSFSITVTVEDAYGNIVPTYLGTIHFSSSDTHSRLPANYTFTASDRGVHTFSGLVLRSAGYQTISVTDTHNGAVVGRLVIDVL